MVLLICISPLCSCASCYAGTGTEISGIFHWEDLGAGVTALFFLYRKRSGPPHYTIHLVSFSVKVTCIISGFAFIYLQDSHDCKEKLSIPAGDCLLGSMAHSCFLRQFHYACYLFSKLGFFFQSVNKSLVTLTQNIFFSNIIFLALRKEYVVIGVNKNSS